MKAMRVTYTIHFDTAAATTDTATADVTTATATAAATTATASTTIPRLIYHS